MQEVDQPKQIHLSFAYSDAELAIDEDIVRRVRFDYDPRFVPVVKTEVYRFSTGGTKTFKNIGVGVGHRSGEPILEPDIYRAPKPFFGFLAMIERASCVAEYWPWKRAADGTPGDTVPFGDWVYDYAKECDDNLKALVARAPSGDSNAIDGVTDECRQLAYKAVSEAFGVKKAADQKIKDVAEEEMRYAIKQEKPGFRKLFAMTDDDLKALAVLQSNPNRLNAVRFSAPQPGKIIVVPR